MFELGPITIRGIALDRAGRDSSPIPPGWLPLERGLNVLYGLNGAGKSLIVESLAGLLSGRRPARTDGVYLELLFNIAAEAFKGDDEDDPRDQHVYARREIAPFLESFQRPGESMIDMVDHVDAEGRAWVYIDDVLDRVERVLEESMAMTAAFPPGIKARDVAAELANQGLFSISGDGTELAIRGMVNDTSPLMSMVADWRATATEEEGNYPNSSIDSIWPSASPEVRAVLPQIYEWCWPSLSVTRRIFPVMGMAEFDADRATAKALNEIARRLPSMPRHGGADRLESASRVIHWGEKSGTAASFREIAERYSDQIWLALTEDGSIETSSAINAVVDALVADANRHYSRLLMDAPSLEIDLGNPQTWLAGDGLLWGARRGPKSPWVALDQLSQAEQRWARISIELALQIDPVGFVILDEPEQALHRSAEAYMAHGLQRLATDFNLCVVVATHSTEVLNLSDASIHLVRRVDQGLLDGRQVHPLKSVDRAELREFGLLPSDLLRRQRGLLLLEGEHDLVVWQALLGEQLDDLRVELIPLRGAGKLNATLDSRVLYDFTDAHLFVVLDALDSQSVTEIWTEACRIAKTQSPQLGAEFAQRELGGMNVDEAQSLAAWASRALALGRESRHTPLTLSAADVLDYLPVESFVVGAESWGALREECAKSRGGNRPSGTQFKEWLRKSKGADLTPQAVRVAAEGMDYIPDEFSDHLARMRVILAR